MKITTIVNIIVMKKGDLGDQPKSLSILHLVYSQPTVDQMQ